MDDYCFICDADKDEGTFLVCEHHLTESCRDVVGLIYVGIGGNFQGEGFTGEEDYVPVTDIYTNVKSFAKSIYHYLDNGDQDELDFVFGRCPVVLIYDSYKITNSDVDILDKLFDHYKPFIVYQKHINIDMMYLANKNKDRMWLTSVGSKLDIRTVVDYWKDDTIDSPLLCFEKLIAD